MTTFNHTDQSAEFIATADSRCTSTEIMEAIAYFARDINEAESLWNGDGFGTVAHMSDIVERVTKNGLHDVTGFYWGAAGNKWAEF